MHSQIAQLYEALSVGKADRYPPLCDIESVTPRAKQQQKEIRPNKHIYSHFSSKMHGIWQLLLRQTPIDVKLTKKHVSTFEGVQLAKPRAWQLMDSLSRKYIN